MCPCLDVDQPVHVLMTGHSSYSTNNLRTTNLHSSQNFIRTINPFKCFQPNRWHESLKEALQNLKSDLQRAPTLQSHQDFSKAGDRARGFLQRFPKKKSRIFIKNLPIVSVSFLASLFTISAPEPAFAELEFCNRITSGSTVNLAIAYYNSSISHIRSSKNDSPDLRIIVNPRWTIRGWWKLNHNECITTIDRNLKLRYYYYYAYSQDDSYDDLGKYPLCGRKYNQFHVEYQMNNKNLVEILALKPSGIDSVSLNSEADLEKACADLGYEFLFFNQIDVGDNEDYIFNLID